MNDRHDPVIPIPTESSEALSQVRAAALARFRSETVVVSWRRQAALLIAGVSGVTLIGALVVAVLQGPAPGILLRVPILVALLAAQAMAVWGFMSPRRSLWAQAAGGLAIVAGVGILALRGPGGGPQGAMGGFICSMSHLAVGLVPLGMVLGGLREAAWSPVRALTGGVALAGAGLLWGEIACDRGMAHVITHHFGAAVVLMAACWVLSRWLPVRSNAR